nr:histone deacetylase 14 [Tanacetum cinerariifolium]
RTLPTIINLCLTGKTSGFETPRVPVLKILWGIVKQANIDYAERIWEEFVQSIHTFIEDKWNLSRHTTGKKRATLIVIPSIRFTKLIIHHLQRMHKFYPRPDSPLYFPNEEPILGYLKFSAMGTKREVCGMPILGSLITTDIQAASYYQEYLESVAKYRSTSQTVGKKRKQATETSDKPPKAKKSKYDVIGKKRSLKYVAALEAEDVPVMEPQVAAEDTNLQKALEESMKTAYALPRGPLSLVVIREPKSGKYQPLPEVPGKGKAKGTEEQVAHDLLILQKPKKKIPADQYIFQRRVSEPNGSSRHDESLYAVLGQSNVEEESKKVVLEADDGGQGEGQARPDLGAQAEGQTGSDAGDQDKGQAGSNLDEISEGQAGPDPGNAGADVHSILSHVVHAGLDRDHMDLDVADVSPPPFTEQLDEGDKPLNANKNVETEVESMVNVLIQQALSSISLMTSQIIDLTSRPESHKVHQQFKATTTDTKTTTTTTTLPPPQAQQQSTAEAMMMKHIGELEHVMANLIQVNKDMEERLDKHGARLYTLEQLDIPHQVSKARDHPELRELLELPDHLKCHHQHLHLHSPIKKVRPKGSTAPSSSKTAASAEYQAWMTNDIRLRPSISLTPADLEVDADMAPDDQAQSSDDEDIRSAYIPKVNLTQDWWKPLEEERPATPEPSWSIPSSDAPVLPNSWALALAFNYSPPPEDSLLVQTGDIATFIDWFCKRRGITELKPQDLEGPAFKIVKVFHPDVTHLQYQMEECHKLLTDSVDDPILKNNVSKPLLLGGPPGHVTIQSDVFFNKYLKYLRYGSKGSRPALSISKMKATYYPDAGLEQMVPDQFWIDEECKYDIATQLTLTKPQWDATGFEYKHDYAIIDSPKAVMFRGKYGVQMMMRFNDIHKFSDGTLQQINEALNYRVKEFRINRMNLGIPMLLYSYTNTMYEESWGRNSYARALIELNAENELKDMVVSQCPKRVVFSKLKDVNRDLKDEFTEVKQKGSKLRKFEGLSLSKKVLIWMPLYNETVNFMTSNPKDNKASTSGTGVENSNMYEQWIETYKDDPYVDVDFNYLGLTEDQVAYAKAFDINPRGQIR